MTCLVVSGSMSRGDRGSWTPRSSRITARPFESTGAFLTADDVNELCQRWIEAERERTHALLTELLIQICDNAIPEVVSRLPELRGPAGQVGPAGKLPIVEEWARETVFYESSVVSYEGGSYQALRDTGEPPDNEAHWKCLAAPGRDGKSIRHRGTFKEDSEYTAYDAVAHNGASFLALHSKPGSCPGPGWQLLSAPGKRGVAGDRGPRRSRSCWYCRAARKGRRENCGLGHGP